MRRGDVYWVDFDPTPGSEIQKTRPAVIVSATGANYRLDRVQVVPLTSNISRVYPSEVIVEADGRLSKALANQIRTVAKERLGRRMGALSPSDLFAVDLALRVQLNLM